MLERSMYLNSTPFILGAHLILGTQGFNHIPNSFTSPPTTPNIYFGYSINYYCLNSFNDWAGELTRIIPWITFKKKYGASSISMIHSIDPLLLAVMQVNGYPLLFVVMQV